VLGQREEEHEAHGTVRTARCTGYVAVPTLRLSLFAFGRVQRLTADEWAWLEHSRTELPKIGSRV
jgi:hypothetical protein